jgi:hypothetical protein
LNYSLLILDFQSKTFHGKIQSAKQAGRRFQIVDILVGIRSDSQVPICELKQLNFDLEKDKWSRPRHTLEDSFETMFGRFSQFNYLFVFFQARFLITRGI